MSQREDFDREAAAIRAIPDGEAKTPNMPMETYHKESEFLDKWCQRDKDPLTAAGLDWRLVEELPYRIGEAIGFDTALIYPKRSQVVGISMRDERREQGAKVQEYL